MKTLLLATALAVTSFSANAEESAEPTVTKNNCNFGQLEKLYMHTTKKSGFQPKKVSLTCVNTGGTRYSIIAHDYHEESYIMTPPPPK